MISGYWACTDSLIGGYLRIAYHLGISKRIPRLDLSGGTHVKFSQERMMVKRHTWPINIHLDYSYLMELTWRLQNVKEYV